VSVPTSELPVLHDAVTWLSQLHATQPVAQAIGVIALVCVAGMMLGSVKVRGIGLGTAGVLFAGIITGSFSKPIDHATLDFVKEFGLILFVFTIGLQLGPGFFAALRRDGLRLNAVAVGVVVAGSAVAVILGSVLKLDSAAVLGLLSGATTNTPSLGAAQQTLAGMSGATEEQLALPALSYAVVYPAAIAGIIGTLLALKGIFRVDPGREGRAVAEKAQRDVAVAEPRTRDDLKLAPGAVTDRRIVVTHRDVVGKTLGELASDARLTVAISRVTRAAVELSVAPELRLQFGDVVLAVGDATGLARAEALLGNSVKELNETHFIPLFAGIALGIAVGTVPIVLPWISQPVRLGLAGGPLVVALAVGHFGRVGRLVFYMPKNANLAFREFGIALFFAAVGLAAGPAFFRSVFSLTGLLWLGAGLCITILPLLAAGLLARAVFGMNFAVLSGLLAGSMTDPPALAFANTLVGSDAPTLAYVTVYPLTTILRIFTAQVLAAVLQSHLP
jgi:AspT/YidE/YbjL antiporter-like protein